MCTLILLCSCFACHRRRRHRKERWALAGMAAAAVNFPIHVHYTAHFSSETAVDSIARGIIRYSEEAGSIWSVMQCLSCHSSSPVIRSRQTSSDWTSRRILRVRYVNAFDWVSHVMEPDFAYAAATHTIFRPSVHVCVCVTHRMRPRKSTSATLPRHTSELNSYINKLIRT